MKIIRAAGLLTFASAVSWGCFDTKVVYSDHDDEQGGAGDAERPGGNGGNGGRSSSGLGAGACLECAEKACPTELARCQRTEACPAVASCMLSCDSSATTLCTTECFQDGVEGAPDATLLVACAYENCAACTDALLGDGGSGGSDVAGGRAGTGGAPQGGKIGAAGRAGAAGSGGSERGGTGGVAAGIEWITFDGNWADEAVPPNDALHVSGTFYAYGDGCAELDWDPESHCASGTLCPFDPPTYANWGIAVGFDFRNTGMNGTPPNTKLLWNPDDIGAKGIAWEISGTAPALQIWVLNMDPVWQGQCSADSCEIAGPPDGASSPATTGQLSFDNLQKDHWGTSGTKYVFDRAAIHALQFKLPGTIAGGLSFSFCIDRLGIVF